MQPLPSRLLSEAKRIGCTGFGFPQFFELAGTPVKEQARVTRSIFKQLAADRVNRLVACSGLGVQPQLTLAADNQSVLSSDWTEFDSALNFSLGLGLRVFRLPTDHIVRVLQQKSHYVLPNDTARFMSISAASGAPRFLTVPLFTPDAATVANKTGIAPLNSEFVRLFRLVAGAIADRLQRKGLLHHFRAVLYDEPETQPAPPGYSHPFAPFTRAAVLAMNGLAKSLAGGDLRMEQTDDGGLPYGRAVAAAVDSWTIKSDAFTGGKGPGWPADLASARRARNTTEAIVYNNAIGLVDLPLMRVRSYPWYIWSTNRNGLGLQGALMGCSFNNWEYSNPWKNANFVHKFAKKSINDRLTS